MENDYSVVTADAKQTAEQTPHEILQTIGLSKAATSCYLYLAEQLPAATRAAYIRRDLQLSRTTLYRALRELTAKGFAQTYNVIASNSYRAIELSEALESYAAYQRQLTRPLIINQRLRKLPLSGTMDN